MNALSERIYQQMLQDLTMGVFPQDQLIIEQNLAECYHASRTPVREALARLVAEGYLNKYPKKGYTIRCVDEKELLELEQTRYIIESGIVRMIIESCTDEQIQSLEAYSGNLSSQYSDVVYANLVFHVEMSKLLGNQMLTDYLFSLLSRIIRPIASTARTSLLNFRAISEDPNYTSPEHMAIYRAIAARDTETALKVLRQDICQIMPF